MSISTINSIGRTELSMVNPVIDVVAAALRFVVFIGGGGGDSITEET